VELGLGCMIGMRVGRKYIIVGVDGGEIELVGRIHILPYDIVLLLCEVFS
jgi:hypothetical protein